MARVFQGTHEATSTKVALKVLTQASPTYTQLFHSEMAALAKLDHPHITWTYDGGVTVEGEAEPAGRPWLAMELARCSIEDEPPRTFSTLLVLLEAVLSALAHAHAHARHVLHRDIKPANLLWHADGRPLLADFGITDLSVRAGTVGFSPPEQLQGGAQGPWSDMFALGKTLRVLSHALPRPRWFDVFLEPMVQEEARLRYATAAEASDALQAGLRGDFGAIATQWEGPPETTAAGARATFVFSDKTQTASGVPVSVRGAPAAADPAFSHDWRLQGAALGLADLRQPAFVGRQALRRALWTHYSEAPDRCRIVLMGRAGHGVRRVATWLETVAREQGRVAPPVVPFGEDVGGHAICWLHVDTCEASVLRAAERWASQVFEVPALPEAGLRVVLRTSLGLNPAEAGLIASLADGDVAWCRRVAAALGRARAGLVWTNDGYEVPLDVLEGAIEPLPSPSVAAARVWRAVRANDLERVEELLSIGRATWLEWAARWYLSAMADRAPSLAFCRVQLDWLHSVQSRQLAAKGVVASFVRAHAERLGAPELAFDALLLQANAHGQQGRDQDAVTLLESWERPLSPFSEARLQNQLAPMLASLGRHADAQRAVLKALTLGAGRPRWLTNAHVTQAEVFILAREPMAAMLALEPAEAAVLAGATVWSNTVHSYAGQALLALGRVEEARARFLAALEDQLAAGQTVMAALSKLNLAFCDLADAHWLAARRRVQSVRVAVHHGGLEQLVGVVELVDAMASLALEDVPAAALALQRAQGPLREHHPQPDVVDLARDFAQLSASLEAAFAPDAAALADALERARP